MHVVPLLVGAAQKATATLPPSCYQRANIFKTDNLHNSSVCVLHFSQYGPYPNAAVTSGKAFMINNTT